MYITIYTCIYDVCVCVFVSIDIYNTKDNYTVL